MVRRFDDPMMHAKPRFQERMKELLKTEEEYNAFCKIVSEYPQNSIRVNTLKISVNELKKRLEKKWELRQPYKEYPEILIIDSKLEPGEIGKSIEHILGYYYIQEIASMMPIIALSPKNNEVILDLCSAPGSKTTQLAMYMENQGNIMANDSNVGRMNVLSTNLQRCGVTNTIVTKMDGRDLCKKLNKIGFSFDKILVDAPCSGEGTIRSSAQAITMFSENSINNLSNIQKSLVRNAISVLKDNGELIYSTCTHAPEENELVVDYILKEFPEMKIQPIVLPLKARSGITKWQNYEFDEKVKHSLRIYPHDNNTEGFFIAKFIKKVKNE